MRLVDADALIKQIEDNICKPCRKRKDDYKGVRCKACQYGDEIDDIDSAPTAQTKKGKWIRIVKHHKDAEQEYSYNEISCSECGAIRKIGWHDARFCPNCGAEMRSYEDEID